MANNATVGVVGVKALLSDLKKMGADTGPLAKAISAAGLKAVQPVAALARSSVPHSSDTLAGDIRTNATKTGATVRMGRARVNYAGWVEFGGTRPQGPSNRAARPFIRSGRYLFPAAEQLKGTVAEDYSAAIQKMLDTFPWTNTASNGGAVHD
jgi:hypothetical protein